MSPKTLLEMAGADLSPNALSQSVLIVIDAQNEYLDGALTLSGVSGAVTQIASLLARARACATPIIHVQQKGKPGGLFDVEARNGALIDAVGALEGETLIHKSLPNSFAGTNFNQKLQETGRKKLIISGFMTHMCVSATARAALDHGYHSTVVSGACATRDLPDPVTGQVIDAATMHRVALTALADRFASIVAAAQDIPD